MDELPSALHEGENADRLVDLYSQQQDLQIARACCERLLALPDGSDPVVQIALFWAAITLYARCFNGGARRRYLGERPLRAIEGARDFHKFVLDLRDKHIAHSVNEYEKAYVGFFLSPHDAEERRVEGVGHLFARLAGWPPENLKNWITVIDLFLAELEVLIERATEAVRKEGEATPLAGHEARSPLGLHIPGTDNVTKSRRE